MTPERKNALKNGSIKYGKKYARQSWRTSGRLTQLIQRLANSLAGFGRSAPPQ